MNNKTFYIIIASFLCLVFTSPAEANVGIPMIVVAWPGMFTVFLPIVLIESIILSRMLKLTPFAILKHTAVANLISTLIGVPIAWIGQMVVTILFAAWVGIVDAPGDSTLYLILSATLGSAWIGSSYEPDLQWMTWVAMLVFLIPAFFASWIIEYRIVARRSGLDKKVCREGLLRANIGSYIFLVISILVLWVSLAESH